MALSNPLSGSLPATHAVRSESAASPRFKYSNGPNHYLSIVRQPPSVAQSAAKRALNPSTIVGWESTASRSVVACISAMITAWTVLIISPAPAASMVHPRIRCVDFSIVAFNRPSNWPVVLARGTVSGVIGTWRTRNSNPRTFASFSVRPRCASSGSLKRVRNYCEA